jgi:DNA-binding response OmpR family regulator
MHILIADDDPVYRNLLSGLLQQWSFTFDAVSNGRQAWEILQHTDSPKLAILDWKMPEMDGFEVCRRTRQVKGDRVPYILLMTGNSKREELLRVLVAGADDYILKPFEPLDLKIRLRLAMRVLDLEERVWQQELVQRKA